MADDQAIRCNECGQELFDSSDLICLDCAGVRTPLERAALELLAVLRDLEWIGMNDGRGVTHARCPACSALKSRGSGHNPYCGLEAAIRKAEAP